MSGKFGKFGKQPLTKTKKGKGSELLTIQELNQKTDEILKTGKFDRTEAENIVKTQKRVEAMITKAKNLEKVEQQRRLLEEEQKNKQMYEQNIQEYAKFLETYRSFDPTTKLPKRISNLDIGKRSSIYSITKDKIDLILTDGKYALDNYTKLPGTVFGPRAEKNKNSFNIRKEVWDPDHIIPNFTLETTHKGEPITVTLFGMFVLNECIEFLEMILSKFKNSKHYLFRSQKTFVEVGELEKKIDPSQLDDLKYKKILKKRVDDCLLELMVNYPDAIIKLNIQIKKMISYFSAVEKKYKSSNPKIYEAIENVIGHKLIEYKIKCKELEEEYKSAVKNIKPFEELEKQQKALDKLIEERQETKKIGKYSDAELTGILKGLSNKIAQYTEQFPESYEPEREYTMEEIDALLNLEYPETIGGKYHKRAVKGKKGKKGKKRSKSKSKSKNKNKRRTRRSR